MANLHKPVGDMNNRRVHHRRAQPKGHAEDRGTPWQESAGSTGSPRQERRRQPRRQVRRGDITAGDPVKARAINRRPLCAGVGSDAIERVRNGGNIDQVRDCELHVLAPSGASSTKTHRQQAAKASHTRFTGPDVMPPRRAGTAGGVERSYAAASYVAETRLPAFEVRNERCAHGSKSSGF